MNKYEKIAEKIESIDGLNLVTELGSISKEIILSDLSVDEKLELFRSMDHLFDSQPITKENPELIHEICEELLNHSLEKILEYWSSCLGTERSVCAKIFLK